MSAKNMLMNAFNSINSDLNIESINIILKIMIENNVNIVKLENNYYLKDNSTLVEFCELAKLKTNGSRPFTKKMSKIIGPIEVLLNIQNGYLNKPCFHYDGGYCSSCKDNQIDISANICKSLSTRYLYEKIKMLETEINILKSK